MGRHMDLRKKVVGGCDLEESASARARPMVLRSEKSLETRRGRHTPSCGLVIRLVWTRLCAACARILELTIIDFS